MIPKTTSLLYAPAGQFVRAQVVELTADLAEQRIHSDWWTDAALLDRFHPTPIDRHWNWNEMGIELDGRPFADQKFALVTDDGSVQGAMLISAEPVPSVLRHDAGSLFIELLFTAPRNRPYLRRDGQDFLKGVGTELLVWGAWRSHEEGCNGRLRLDGSPEHLDWYTRRGLQKLDLEPIVYEGVEYTPMELPDEAARRLLGMRNDQT